MKTLRRTLQPSASDASPLAILLIAMALQALLLAGYFFGVTSQSFDSKSRAWQWLMAHSGLVFIVAIFAAAWRARWIRREGRVRQRLLDVIEAIPDPAMVRDLRGRYVMWNPAAEQFHGFKASHAFLKTPFELFPEPVAKLILDLEAQALTAERSVVQRCEFPPLYGKGRRVVMMHTAPVASGLQSDARGTITILHDVTDAEREANALRHLSTQLKLALDTSGFGSWIWDLDSDVLTCSEQFQALLHYKGEYFRKDFVFRERLHPEDQERVLAAVKRSIQLEIPFNEPYRLLSFKGDYVSFSGSGQCAKDSQGKNYFAGLLVPAANARQLSATARA
jgi:PAS domain S-box-containing protein